MHYETRQHSIVFFRDAGDPKFYGVRYARGEHALLHFLKKELNKQGWDLIKKLMRKDGHMVSEYQPYLRARFAKSKGPNVCIYSGFFAIRGANEDWNAGEVTLNISECWKK